MRIGRVEIRGRLALAPMAGVTDAAFREVCRAHGAGYTCTEMISAKALCYQDKKTRELMVRGEGETPLALQLFGSDPDCMAEAARRAMAITAPEIIDINMGCPVGKVVRAGDGSALMLKPALAEQIVAAVAKAVDVPVTVKMRKGFDSANVNAVEIARRCEAAGAAAVAVHGRTRAQLYAGRADWDIIRAVKEAVRIPVFANGDVFSGEDAAHILRYTGADAVMIGRGAMGYPWLFDEAAAALAGREAPPPPTAEERIDTAVRQFERAAALRGERLACLEARKHFAWYVKGLPWASFYREKIMAVAALRDIYVLAQDIKDSARDGERGKTREERAGT